MSQVDLFAEKFPKTRERDACDAVSEIVAMVETMAARKCSARQIVEAVRTFAARQQETTPQVQGVWIMSGSPEWRAWAAYRGKSPPLDKRGGWRFPSKMPPAMEAAE